MIRVRFHLASGPNYKSWQVRSEDSVEYHRPETSYIIMRGCKLINERNTAEKVYEKQRRDVCGWVACESCEVLEGSPKSKGRMLLYDPKIAPYWTTDHGANIDNTYWQELVTDGKRVFASF